MATKPSVALAAIGQKISATLWNNGVYRVWNFLDVTKPVCAAIQTVAQAALVANTFTSITFDSEQVDTDNQHSTASNTSRVVIGNTLGWYRVTGAVCFSVAAGTRIGAHIALNGTAISGSEEYVTLGSATFTSVTAFALVQATAAADFVELQGFTAVSSAPQISGALKPYMTVEYIGTLQ
jgi:hypothetical protein